MGLETGAALVLVDAFAAVTGTSITVAEATTAVYALTAAAVIGGSIALSAALAPSLPAAGKAGKQSVAIEGGPRIHVVGRDKRPASLLFSRSKGRFDLHRVGYFCEGEIDGIEEIRVSGRRVARGSDHLVKTEPFRGTVEIDLRTGTSTQLVFGNTAAAFLARYPASAKGLGAALAEWIATSPGYDDPDHAQIFAVGYPTLEAVVRGPRIFDPRLGSDPTDAGHRIWTDNSVLQILEFMLRSRSAGGWGSRLARWDIDDIAAVGAAQAEAATPIRGGGTEWRSRLWGSQALGPDTPLVDTLKIMLLSAGADILLTKAGKYTIRLIDDAPSPTAVLPWGALLPGAVIDGGPLTFDRANEFTLKYLAEDRDFDVVEADVSDCGWARIQSEIDRTGTRPATIELPMCPSVHQASRIGRRVAAMRRARKVGYVAGLAGLALAGHAEATVLDEDLGVAVPVVIDAVVSDFKARTVAIDGIVKPVLAAFDPEADGATPPEIREEVPDSEAPNDPTVNNAIIVATGWGGTRTWAVRVKISFSSGSGDAQQVIYAPSTDAGHTWDEWTPLDRASGIFAGVSPTFLQSPNHASLTAARVSASSSTTAHDVSAWVDAEVTYAPPSAQLPAPTAGTVDNGDGTHAVNVTGDITTAYYIAYDVSTGAIVAQGDASPSGAWSIAAVSDGIGLVIYGFDSADRPSPSVGA